jgi:catechol-2,3-dioxygenase
VSRDHGRRDSCGTWCGHPLPDRRGLFPYARLELHDRGNHAVKLRRSLPQDHTYDRHVRIDRLDHLVLTVADIDATVDFYTRVLGMEAVTFGAGRTALAFGHSKINLHRAGHEFEPKARRPAAPTCA